MTQAPLANQFMDTPVGELAYEQAFDELEQVVAALEAGEHSLDEGVNLYARGQALARHCAALLEKAELKVRQLAGDELEEFSG